MVREIVWRDLLRLFRYRDQELFLDNSRGLAYSPGILSNVILSLLFPASGFCTAVEDDGEKAPPLFGQIYCSPSKTTAKVTFLAPREEVFSPSVVKLLSYLSEQAGEKGGFSILAEVERDSILEDCFREAGFQPYAEQHIWLASKHVASAPQDLSWQPIKKKDELTLQNFYRQRIPRGVQRVEPLPSAKEHPGLTCWDGHELLGFATFHWGPRGILVDPVMDTAVADLEGPLQAIFEALSPYQHQKVYFRVRTYQEKVASALEKLGAEPGPAQLAMVKYLAVHYRAQGTYKLSAFDTRPDITTPFIKSKANHHTYDQ